MMNEARLATFAGGMDFGESMSENARSAASGTALIIRSL
jgi:hypothetical protein